MDELSRRERRKLQREEHKAEERADATKKGFGKYLIVLLCLAVLGFIGFKIYKWAVSPVPEMVGEAVEAKDGDWIKGSNEASVTLIEYSDFQCPACKSYSPLISRIADEYKDKLKIVYRHYPLPQHKNAKAASYAAEAAGKQEKFWEMHDLLFERQEEWSDENDITARFEGYAKDTGLDVDKWRTDYESQEVKDAVMADITLANSIGVNSTPTFVLNGKKVTLSGYNDLKNKVDSLFSSQ